MILKGGVSNGFTTWLGMEIPPSAPPFVVMILAETADKTDIMATVVTNAGILKTDARMEFSKEHPTPTPKIERIITARLPVALYAIIPAVALKSVAAPRLISKDPNV